MTAVTAHTTSPACTAVKEGDGDRTQCEALAMFGNADDSD